MISRPLRFHEVVRTCLICIGSFFGAAAGGFALGEQVDVVAIGQWGTSVLALVLLPVLERPTWRTLQSSILWAESSSTVLRRLTTLYRLKMLVFVAVVGAGLVIPPSPAVLVSFACWTGLLFGAHWMVFSHMGAPCEAGAITDADGGEMGEPAKSKFLTFFKPELRLPGLLVLTLPRSLNVALAMLRKAWKMRLAIAFPTMLLAGLPVACVLAYTINIAASRHHHDESPGSPSPSPSASITSTSAHTTKTQTHTQESNSTTTSPKSPPPAPPTWDGICPATPAQTEAKEPAISSIMEMYEPGTTPAPRDKGCMGHIYPKHFNRRFHSEFYATMIGSEPETLRPLSFCVDTEAFGAAVFLWNIAAKIEELMIEVGPVGGPPVSGGRFPRYEVGDTGEVVLADTHKGVYMFIRRAPSENWVELMPTEARALLGAMNSYGRHWLWPSQPESQAHGVKVVKLRFGPDERPVTAITLKADGEAFRGSVGYPPDPKKEPNVKELKEFALTAE